MVTKKHTSSYASRLTSPWYGILRDTYTNTSAPTDVVQLELHFNDLYHLLQRNLSKLTYETDISPTDVQKIQNLVTEVIRVKGKLSQQNSLTE